MLIIDENSLVRYALLKRLEMFSALRVNAVRNVDEALPYLSANQVKVILLSATDDLETQVATLRSEQGAKDAGHSCIGKLCK